MNNSPSVSPNSVDHKVYIKYIPIIERLKQWDSYFSNPKVIYIFNCEHNKYFITYATACINTGNFIDGKMQNNFPVYVPSTGPIDLGDRPISFFVNNNCPHLNECNFIKNNKIISIRDIKCLSLYEYIDLNNKMRSLSLILYAQSPNFQILRLMELYENSLDNLIIKYMHKYGIDNVRGGSFSDEILTETQEFQIQQLKDKLLNLDQLNGESTIKFDQQQIKLNLTTKYINIENIEDEVIKYKAELIEIKTELAKFKSELAKFKSEFVKTNSNINNLETLD
jgi:hypothetical protein